MTDHREQIDAIKAERRRLASDLDEFQESNRAFVNYKLDAMRHYLRGDTHMIALLDSLEDAMREDHFAAERFQADRDYELANEQKRLQRVQDLRNEGQIDSKSPESSNK
ncbi:MAG: hypothetical protein LBH87_02710 [Coriobacteriales bacterium]|nr:hypothetical protein [Coriobacteriales bacterium]